MNVGYAYRKITLTDYSVEYTDGEGFFIHDNEGREFYVSKDTMLLVKQAIEDDTEVLWFGKDGLIFCRPDDSRGLHWVWASNWPQITSQIMSPEDTYRLLSWLNDMEDIWTNH